MSKQDQLAADQPDVKPREGDASDSPTAATPLWPASRRPFGPERRKDPAAADRHEEVRTGVAPTEAITRRQAQERPPARVISYWDKEDA